MVVRMRATRSHRDNRRSHHSLVRPALSTCSSCGATKLSHVVCESCGKYNGRVVIDIAALAVKSAKKAEARKKATATK